MKHLTYIHGNLLSSKGVDVIAHQANCQNTFGSGIARSIREIYPKAYDSDCIAAKIKTNTLGNISMTAILPEDTDGLSDIRFIVNLYGQNLGTDHKKLGDRKTDYEALFTALQRMRKWLDKGDPLSVGFPYLMGSALGGGDWRIVERLIEVAFDGYEGDVFIYDLNGTSPQLNSQNALLEDDQGDEDIPD